VLKIKVKIKKTKMKFFNSTGRKTPLGVSKISQKTRLPPPMAKGHKILIELCIKGSVSWAQTRAENLLNFHRARNKKRKV
jgi:hypothetical protein